MRDRGGRLELILGCMFSGKSSELIRRLKRFQAIDKNILVINSLKDTRSENEVLKTHDNVFFDCIKTNNLMKVVETSQYKNTKIIGIDESQFFSNLISFVECSLKHNKHLIVTGLDGDFKQNLFGEILFLIPLAEQVDKLNAYCMECNDGTLAPFTKRIVGISDSQEVIGSNDIYKAVCREHLSEVENENENDVNKLLEECIKEKLKF
jgi:thymidine kinase